ncbi:uncharacterized protein sha [Prorops nasuta]|uniref:uncharacterized protein sha n=1 Tax=Prorops nasuta TaxID=863751 RepID=UPI0034CD55DC
MRLLGFLLLGCLQLSKTVTCQEISVSRYSDGDIFIIQGPCTNACMVLSSGTASLYSRSPSTAGLVASNDSCTCQCNPGLPVFREDLHICVNDIHECNVAGFVSSSENVERVPYVFLPQRGQIIYPHAEIRFEGVITPVCGIAGAQQLGKSGWLELRNLSEAEPPFRLFRDEGRTFLQWIGDTGLRDATEGRVVIAKLVCRDASPESSNPAVFTPCVAFRVAGSPSKSNTREVTFATTPQVAQGLSNTEYTVIGLSSILLAVIYVASVSLYLQSRRSKRKSLEDAEIAITGGRDGNGFVKNNPLLAASRHFESDTNSGLTESDIGDELPQSDGEQGFENVTSAIIHPRCLYPEHSEGAFGSGSILGERLPEEDVRVVETADSQHQQDVPVLPGTQRRKLYFNPAYFDRQLLLAPPPAAIEFLLKIREVISIAKHKMAAKRFVPTLIGIPEEESGSERCGSTSKQQRLGNFIETSGAGRTKRSQRCTGCPGCSEALRSLPVLPVDSDQTSPGESKVRAWLEDVKPSQRRWKEPEVIVGNSPNNLPSFTRTLEYLREIARRDFNDLEASNSRNRPMSSWRDNKPTLRTFGNAARSEILENEDKYSVSGRSTKSMFEETNYDRYYLTRKDRLSNNNTGNDTINAKIRKAIENSFIQQMEETAELGVSRNVKKINENGKIPDKNLDNNTKTHGENLAKKRLKKKAPAAPPKKELPDMINELPATKTPAKRIMDAVIREMVDTKSVDQPKVMDYEVDSLERSKFIRKSSTSPESTDHSSPSLSTALPMDEELTIQNAIINAKTGQMTMSRLNKQVLKKNYYNNLPELLSSQRTESYSLVSEVYVNDGYASPANSDDSGPEIQYEPENPGHLTIKVQDSPENYIKQDESEYEPDTLDRKPMKLRINGDVHYEREFVNEVYVDSLERPGQILLKSKGSFRDEDLANNCATATQHGYGSLREIYEARLKASVNDSSPLDNSLTSNNEKSSSWEKSKYLTPDSKQAKRQRHPSNRPDVVPMPPAEDIYQRPKPPRRVETVDSRAKNDPDRSSVEAGDPTTSSVSPVHESSFGVGTTICVSCAKNTSKNSSSDANYERVNVKEENRSNGSRQERSLVTVDETTRAYSMFHSRDDKKGRFEGNKKLRAEFDRSSCLKHLQRNCISSVGQENRKLHKIEDSGYLSSTDSNGSNKQLLRHEVSSVSETDETESVCDGASESGAESIGTDSVFFGNFRRLSNISNLSKSADSGLGLCSKNSYLQTFGMRNESRNSERTNCSASDSETESFVTVLPPTGNKRSSLVT